MKLKVNDSDLDQQMLISAIARIRQALERRELDDFVPMSSTALDRVCDRFELSSFERDILLLCAGVELEGDFAALCATAQNNPQRAFPTFSLALAVLPDAHWSALAPQAPLRRWKLIEVGAGNALTTSPLRIDEQILHYLIGTRGLEERLAEVSVLIDVTEPLVPSQWQLIEDLTATWSSAARNSSELPIVQLCGKDPATLRSIAASACTQLQLTPYAIVVNQFPIDLQSLNLIKRLWEREFLLNEAALLLEFASSEALDVKQISAIAYFTERVQAPVILLNRDRIRQRQRKLLTFDVSSPTLSEQRLLWEKALHPLEPTPELLDPLISHFALSASEIQTACTRAATQQDFTTHLWQFCRTQARPRLDELAQRMDSTVSWEDLILPQAEQQVLRDAATQLRHRTRVYDRWGFGGKTQRGLGMSALFAGASGTGKTLAAEVLANELQLDLYRIDLSAVVSKYIGETEKNLGRVFDAAEVGGVILLFDEADSLFGKRSDVKDSHDRYANMEVSYLLQRMEAYRGLSVLTTNLKNSIDQAFLRRIRFIVQFPFPDAAQRSLIWQRVFPPQTPTERLDFAKLAKLNVAGGTIRNIALNSAFIAAEAGEAIQMQHILQAARNEYTKLERPLTDVEVKGWL
jgi:hypothetical protein